MLVTIMNNALGTYPTYFRVLVVYALKETWALNATFHKILVYKCLVKNDSHADISIAYSLCILSRKKAV